MLWNPSKPEWNRKVNTLLMIFDTDEDPELLKAESCLPANNQMVSQVIGTE